MDLTAHLPGGRRRQHRRLRAATRHLSGGDGLPSVPGSGVHGWRQLLQRPGSPFQGPYHAKNATGVALGMVLL